MTFTYELSTLEEEALNARLANTKSQSTPNEELTKFLQRYLALLVQSTSGKLERQLTKAYREASILDKKEVDKLLKFREIL
jgi:hypothetical protein